MLDSPSLNGSSGTQRPIPMLERELLVCCARTDIDARMVGRIGMLLQQDIDWPYLIGIATGHQVESLLSWNLCRKFADACPSEILNELSSLLRSNAARNLSLTHELLRLLNVLDTHGIPAIPYKGPVLAASIYGRLALRSFTDLDIWVGKRDYHFRVDDVLVSHGWQPIADYGWERTFTNADGSVRVDVHEGLTHGQMPFTWDFRQLWKRCISVPILGRTVRTLAPSDLLIVLCVQLAKDVAQQNGPPLIKICDIAELVRNHHDLDWKSVIRRSARLGALRILYLGLLAGEDLLDIALPNEVRQNAKLLPEVTSLITHVRERVLDESRNRYSRPELLVESRWHSEVRERIRDRDRLLRTLISATTPTQADYSFVRLPLPLFSLYHLVRPIRLIYKCWCIFGRVVSRKLRMRRNVAKIGL
jgi:hypothetical protein